MQAQGDSPAKKDAQQARAPQPRPIALIPPAPLAPDQEKLRQQQTREIEVRTLSML